MRNLAIGAACGLLLSGCDAPPPQPPVDYLAQDNARCAGLGFVPGSAEMAQCIQTASSARQAEADRAAQQKAAADRQQQRQQAKQEADDAAWRQQVDAGNAKRRAEAEAVMNSSGDPFDQMVNPGPDPVPSAAATPGMQCSGVGDAASYDALSSY